MAITQVQQVGTKAVSATGQSSISVTVPAGGVAAGNLLVVAVGFGGLTSRDVTGSDSGSNTYQTDVRADKTTNQTPHVVVLSALVGTALAASDTITMSFVGGTVNYPLMIVYEYSGLAASSWLDASAGDIGSSAAPDSGSDTTTVADTLLIGACCYDVVGGNYTAGSGYVELHENSNTTKRLQMEEDIVSSTGSYNADGSLAASKDWAQVFAAYKQASTAASLPPIRNRSQLAALVR